MKYCNEVKEKKRLMIAEVDRQNCRAVNIGMRLLTIVLTRAPLGYFYNAPHWGGGGAISSPPSDLRNYWTDYKNSSGI